MGRWIALGILALTAACAPATPLLSGGSTAPVHRTDVLAGGAARVVFDESQLLAAGRPDSRFGRATIGGGLSPVLAIRHGIARNWDVGFMSFGPIGRLELRREFVIREAVTRPSVILGAGLTGGYVPSADGERGGGGRVGIEVPVVYAIEFGGVYDVWMGGRVAIEHARGRFEREGAAATVGGHATALRTGPVLGLSIGTPSLHAMLEISGLFEQWFGDHDGIALRATGLVLVPAFAIRGRL